MSIASSRLQSRNHYNLIFYDNDVREWWSLHFTGQCPPCCCPIDCHNNRCWQRGRMELKLIGV